MSQVKSKDIEKTTLDRLKVHGAKIILGVIILGIVSYISNLTATVWRGEKRLDKVEPEIIQIKKENNDSQVQQKVMLKNQCQIMRHFKIGDKKECI